MHHKVLLAMALASSSAALAQDTLQPPPIFNPQPAPLAVILIPALRPVIPPDAPYTPLSIGDNYKYAFDRVFSPGKLILFGLKASMDEERDFPRKWGEGMEGFGERYADHFGRALVREHIKFAVRAIDGEDPRYELSHDTGVWKRSKHAIARTFVTRGHDGQLMPAYSRFVADFATPFIAEQWEPDGFDAGRALRNGVGAFAFALGANLASEFWPDIRRKLQHRWGGFVNAPALVSRR